MCSAVGRADVATVRVEARPGVVRLTLDRPAQGDAYRRLDPVPADTPAVREFTHTSSKVSLPMPAVRRA